MTRPFDICILGDGIVGHVLALSLARERLRVGLVLPDSRDNKDQADVRAYALNQQSRVLLDSLRCWPEPAQATAVLAMQVQDIGGGAVAFDAAQQGVEALAWIVDVPSLQARLADALQFQSGIELLPVAPQAGLTVVCEGRASSTRASLGVQMEMMPYRQWAIAARVQCELAHAQTACQWFSPDATLGFLPLDGAMGNSMAIVWSVNQEQHAELMAMDAQMFASRLEQACARRFGGLTLAGARVAWPLQLATAKRWSGVSDGRSWVLAGDAAHVLHPLAGQGLNLGLSDVAELVRLIAGRDYWREVNDDKLLRRYERARKAAVLLMGATTDGLQQLFARPGAAWAGVRNFGMAGFERSGMLKRWVARQAMGIPGRDDSASFKPL